MNENKSQAESVCSTRSKQIYIPATYSILDTTIVHHEPPSPADSVSDDDYLADQKEFLLRFNCLKEMVLRLSWQHKLNFLKRLCEQIDELEHTAILLSVLRPAINGKTAFYSEVMYNTKFEYDKLLKDHDRALDPDIVQKTQDEEVSWFSKLAFSQQLSVLIGLIRISGGGIMRKMYRELLRRYNIQMIVKLETQNLKKVEEPEEEDEVHPVRRSKTFSEMKLPDKEVSEELAKRRRAWEEMINKYRIQVEGKPKEVMKKSKKSAKGLDKKKGKGAKGKESSKGEKKSKSSKASESSGKSAKIKKSRPSKEGKAKDNKDKKGKKGKKDKKKKKEAEVHELDYVQLLPIWCVMKIFNYLDPKNLKKIKAVHPYWSMVVDIVIEERKARKALDKMITKVESQIDNDLEDDYEKRPKFEYYKLSLSEKKMIKMQLCGVSRKEILNTKHDKCVTDTSLLVSSLQQMKDCYILPVQYLKSYPRLCKSSAPLYHKPSCFLKDVNVAFNSNVEDTDTTHDDNDNNENVETETDEDDDTKQADMTCTSSNYTGVKKPSVPIIRLEDESTIDSW